MKILRILFFILDKQRADICPNNATYYGNRSAAYLALGKHKEAVDDARMATCIDENYVKVSPIVPNRVIDQLK